MPLSNKQNKYTNITLMRKFASSLDKNIIDHYNYLSIRLFLYLQSVIPVWQCAFMYI